MIPLILRVKALEAAMMGRRRGDQASLFYEFRLDDRIPKDHLLRRIDGFVTAALADLHERLEPYYSEIGRPSGSIAAGPAKAAELRRGGEWKTTPSTMRQSTCGRWRWSSLQLAIRWSELSVSKAPANEKPQPEGGRG